MQCEKLSVGYCSRRVADRAEGAAISVPVFFVSSMAGQQVDIQSGRQAGTQTGRQVGRQAGSNSATLLF